MFELDHVAIQCENVPLATQFYVENYGAKILYADQTWAFLRVGEGKIALVTPSQHPAHLAFRVDEPTLQERAQKAGKPIDLHRDGTRGIYLEDESGNTIELICYPVGGTIYESNSSNEKK